MKRLALALVAVALCLLPAPGNTPEPCPLPCPVEGCRGEAELNRQKNRTGEPSEYHRLTFGKFVELNNKAVNKKRRHNWTDEEKAAIAGLEDGAAAVILVGYLYDAKYSVSESCNCFRPEKEWLDFHIWLVRDGPHSTKPESVVVEITPRIRQTKTGWELTKLRKLIPPHRWTKVRVKGYLFFDNEHWDFPQRTPPVRATAWEIHPVIHFTVCPPQTTCRVDSEEGWVSLENYTVGEE